MPEIVSASFRDPSGFVFKQDDEFHRQVNLAYKKDYDLLMSSGLYRQLSKAKALITHQELSLDLSPLLEIAYKIIKPQQLGFISYPYEWCFNQYKDAAILTLSIARRALEYGISLKDASAYNIQFLDGRPIFIDTLSFEAYQEGLPWVAYKQFCQHFLAPLALMAKTDTRLSALMRNYIDGIPLDLASKLLPRSTKLNFGLATHIHFHAKSQEKYADQEISQEQVTGKMSKQAIYNLIDSLLSLVRSLSVKTITTEWADYYQDNNYTESSFEAKRDLVTDFIKAVNPKTVWDLGGNTGEFSRCASDLGIPTVSFDIDPGAVQQNYDIVKTNKEKFILPLVMDLTNPSPAIGWHNQERDSLIARGPVDLIMALALIHHMAIANNVPLREIARSFADLGKFLIIEFVPKQDSQVQRLLSSRLDIFPDYNPEGFKQAFLEYYTILNEQPVQGSERSLFLMKRKQ
ncbi:MAG TPA: hypothetical protein PK459_01045 [Anaerolineaceae bacterium]|jgi:hypothetical protein|nr:hypothetical protein [Anaerolineaceae bacterium]